MDLGPQNITVLDGKDATLNCRAVGAPTPNVTWIYNGKFTKVFVKFPCDPAKTNFTTACFFFVLYPPLATNSLQI